MTPATLRDAIHSLAADDGRPVAIWSALWPFARAMGGRRDDLAARILEGVLTAISSDRTVLMPTFPKGPPSDGPFELETVPTASGLINEAFRRLPGVRHTASRFFPFAVHGPAADRLAALRPDHVWGDGSLYAWLEAENAVCLTLGVHPTGQSLLHRAEWLCREQIRYRFVKRFEGEIVQGGQRETLVEQLFVRDLTVKAISQFDHLGATLEARAGLRKLTLDGVGLAAFDAAPALEAVVERLRRDPLDLVANRIEVGAHYAIMTD